MLLFFAPIIYLLIGYPVLLILRKAGYSGWFSLICAIPGVNIIALWIFAFADWPARPTSTTVFD